MKSKAEITMGNAWGTMKGLAWRPPSATDGEDERDSGKSLSETDVALVAAALVLTDSPAKPVCQAKHQLNH